jgi:hypothetical protein
LAFISMRLSIFSERDALRTDTILTASLYPLWS